MSASRNKARVRKTSAPRGASTIARETGPEHSPRLQTKRPDRRVNAALVLAAASAMVGVGAVALISGPDSQAEPLPPSETHVLVDQTTPERAAESFLDAWRKREHRTALGLSVGPAREKVQARIDADRSLSEHERRLKAQVWDAMAQERLRLLIDSSDILNAGRLRLRGTMEGPFLGHHYVRRVTLVTAPQGDEHVVEDIEFGAILSNLPAKLRLE